MITTITDYIQKVWIKKLLEKGLIDVNLSAPLMMMIGSIDDDELYKIEKYHDKRSLIQNGYAWELIQKLADDRNLSKEEVYLMMLKDYGQSVIVSVDSTKDISTVCKYYEEIGRGEIKGKPFTHYKIFKGSSEFNKKEMKIFIDGIIQECENVGIPTLTPEQIARLE